jgi:hypothetical protein
VSETLEVDSHEESRHLFFGDVTALIGVEDPRNRVVTKFVTISLGADHVNGREPTH